MTKPRHLLVACHQIVLSGGLLRFDRTADALRPLGYETAFTTLGRSPGDTTLIRSPVIPFAHAADQQWDSVMVPGAGFPKATIRSLARFVRPNFGRRVQHILNEASRKPAFKAVNQVFQPQVVVFNNPWTAGSFTDLSGERFHLLQGGVDTGRFAPGAGRHSPLQKGRWIVGGLANKHPDLLLEACERLGPGVTLRLMGTDTRRLAWRKSALVRSGRLELTGPLDGEALSRFYQEVDCVVSIETEAGWANLAAEGAASGTPVVATPHGVSAFGRDGATALIIEDPAGLAEAIARLRDNPALGARLAANARRAVEPFTWKAYAKGLADILDASPGGHYFAAPDLGLHGKWPISARLNGLESLLALAEGSTVIDFGAAEGLIARAFLDRGAASVTGFEIAENRVEAAAILCGDRAEFHAADLGDWTALSANYPGLLAKPYDVVLYLGIHQHLPRASRLHVLQEVLKLSSSYFACRMPEDIYRADRIDALLLRAGFTPLGEAAVGEVAGPVRVFRKEPAS